MSLKQKTQSKSLEETFHYKETWLRNLFHNGKSGIDSMFIADILGAGWNFPGRYGHLCQFYSIIVFTRTMGTKA